MSRSASAGSWSGNLEEACDPLTFESVYEQQFDYVWRTLRVLGVERDLIDDALQDTFVVVHRRLPEFQGRARIETWLFAIAQRVAQRYRRSAARRDARAEPLPDEPNIAATGPNPREAAESAEAARLLTELLDQLDDDRRAVFVLVEIEQFVVPAAAAALGINVNTAYSRLRQARLRFEQALARRLVRGKRSPR